MTNHQYGPNGHIVDAFLEHLEGMTEADWFVIVVAWVGSAPAALNAAEDAALKAAWETARKAATWQSTRSEEFAPLKSLVNAAERAIWEIQGADLLRERGQPFFFLPMFGFADEQAIIKQEAPTIMIFGVEVKSDHTFDRDSVERYIEQAHKAGQEDERAKIVAWLKTPLIRLNNLDGFFRASALATAEDLDDAATKIEAGEHLK